MEDIENYKIFGINIGGGKEKSSGKQDDDLSTLTGMFGGAILGFSLGQLFGSILDGNFMEKLTSVIKEMEGKRNINEKLKIIKIKIASFDDVDVYGGILMLFSELEKFVDQMHSKYIRIPYKPDSFRERVSDLERRGIITGAESHVLRYEIYPKRNLISHGKYQDVDRKEVTTCFEFISQFINKYSGTLQ